MAICPTCRRDISDNQPICPHCGARAEGARTISAPGEPPSLEPDNSNHRIRLWGKCLVVLGLALLLATLFLPIRPGLAADLYLLAAISLLGSVLLLYKAGPKRVRKPWERCKQIGDVLALFGLLWMFLPHNMSAPLGLAMIVIGLALRLAYLGSSKTQWRYVPQVTVMVGLLGGGFIVMMWMGGMKTDPLKARQAYARGYLGGIYVAELSFYEEHKRYGTLEEIGFKIPEYHHYTYRIDTSGMPGTVIPASNGHITPDNSIVPAGFSATGFTATATGNIDNDSTIDQWHMNDAKCCLKQADVNDITK